MDNKFNLNETPVKDNLPKILFFLGLTIICWRYEMFCLLFGLILMMPELVVYSGGLFDVCLKFYNSRKKYVLSEKLAELLNAEADQLESTVEKTTNKKDKTSFDVSLLAIAASLRSISLKIKP